MREDVRYHGFDQLRAILMLSGVVFHASLVVGPGGWAYTSAQHVSLPIFYVVQVSHFFRMETFFAISGLFAYVVTSRKGRGYFVEGRLKRVLVPLLISMLFVTPLQIAFSVGQDLLDPGDVRISNLVAHLWFLLALLMVSLLIAAVPECCLSQLKRRFQMPQFTALAVGAVALTILVPRVIAYASDALLPGYENAQIAMWYLLAAPAKYGAYFVFGFALAMDGRLFKWIAQVRKTPFAVAFAICAAALLGLKHLSVAQGGGLPFTLYMLQNTIEVACASAAIVILLGVFSGPQFRPSRLVNFLVRSSLPVYIFHQPVLVVIAFYLDGIDVGVHSYYILVCLLTYAVSFTLFLIVDSFSITRNAFGGWKSEYSAVAPSSVLARKA